MDNYTITNLIHFTNLDQDLNLDLDLDTNITNEELELELNLDDVIGLVGAENSRDANETLCTERWERTWKRTDRLLTGIFSAVIILFGSTGNTIAYFVLKQKSYKNNVMASALRYLAILDNTVLWTVVLRIFFKSLLDIDAALTSRKICLFFQFHTSIMTSCANWLLVIITLTRLIHLRFPFKTQVICSRLNYYALITLIHVLIIFIHGGITLSILNRDSLTPGAKYISCYTIFSKEEAVYLSHVIMNVTISALAPGCLLITINFLILREIRKMEERTKLLKANPFDVSAKSMDEGVSNTLWTTAVGWISGTSKTANISGNALELNTLPSETTRKVDSGAPGAAGTSSLQPQNNTTHGSKLYYARTWSEAGPTEDGDSSVDWLFLERDDVRQRPHEEGNVEFSGKGKLWATQNSLSPFDFVKNFSENSNIWSLRDDIPETSNLSGSVVSASTAMLGSKTPTVIESNGTSIALTPSVGTVKSNTHSLDLPGWKLWGTTKFQRVSIALSQPIDLDNEYTPSSDADERKESGGSTFLGRIICGRQSVSDEKTNTGDSTNAQSNSNKGPSVNKRDSRVQSLTRLLMMASFVFLILNAPYWMYHLFSKSWQTDEQPGCARRQFVRHMLLLLRYSNHSLNFFFYCASGSRFRQEYFTWLRKIRGG